VQVNRSYLVSREPLSPSRLTDNKVNVSHQFIIEHHRISAKETIWHISLDIKEFSYNMK